MHDAHLFPAPDQPPFGNPRAKLLVDLSGSEAEIVAETYGLAVTPGEQIMDLKQRIAREMAGRRQCTTCNPLNHVGPCSPSTHTFPVLQDCDMSAYSPASDAPIVDSAP